MPDPQSSTWNANTYTASLTSRCWWFTPYDDGWHNALKWGGDLQNDAELRAILEMELALPEVPEWARRIVNGPIRHVAPCGHYRFPLSYLDAVDTIGRQSPPPLAHTCYTVDHERKLRAQDYAFSLDAWLAGAQPQEPAAELSARNPSGPDWPKVCQDLWQVLGQRTELKLLLVERMLHHLRWYLKTTVWDDDPGLLVGRDQYLGPYRLDEDLVRGNGNSHWPKGGIAEHLSPRVKAINQRIAELTPHANWFSTVIVDFSWLCAPKAFRMMEKTLWCIGREKPVISLPSFPLENPEPVPNFLQCQDTIPDFAQSRQWWRNFIQALADWWQGTDPTSPLYPDIARRLGDPTPTKRWLVRLLAHRLRMLQRDSGSIHKLVGSAS